MQWSINLGGEGFIVCNDSSIVANADNTLFCIDGESGKTKWKVTIDGDIVRLSEIFGNGLFVNTSKNQVHYIDISQGKPVWTFQADDKVLSPVQVNDNKAYFGSLNGKIFCLDVSNGKLLWSYNTYGKIGFPVNFYKDKVLVSSYDKNVYMLDANTGRLIKRFSYFAFPLGMFINQNYLYFLEIDKLYCIDIEKGTEVWKTDDFDSWRSRYLIQDFSKGRVLLYTSGETSKLTCFDASTGRVIFNKSIFFNSPVNSPCIDENKIYFVINVRRDSYLLKFLYLARPLLTERLTYKIYDFVAPKLKDGGVYYKSFLVAFDSNSGKVIWKAFLFEDGYSRVFISRGKKIFVYTDNGYIYSFNLE